MTEEQVLKYLDNKQFVEDLIQTDVKLLTPKVQYKFLQLLKKYKRYADADYPDDFDNSQYQKQWNLRQSLITLMKNPVNVKLIPQLVKFYEDNYEDEKQKRDRLRQLRGL